MHHAINVTIVLIFLSSLSCSQPMVHRREGIDPIWVQRQLVVQDSVQVFQQRLLNQIKTYLGTPYRYGGDSSDGMDCSGLVSAVFKEAFGIDIPHNAYHLYQTSHRIKKKDLYLGDLVFFTNRRSIDHVGIYLIKNYFVHASTSSGVKISNLNDHYYRSRFRGGGRIINLNPQQQN